MMSKCGRGGIIKQLRNLFIILAPYDPTIALFAPEYIYVRRKTATFNYIIKFIRFCAVSDSTRCCKIGADIFAFKLLTALDGEKYLLCTAPEIIPHAERWLDPSDTGYISKSPRFNQAESFG